MGDLVQMRRAPSLCVVVLCCGRGRVTGRQLGCGSDAEDIIGHIIMPLFGASSACDGCGLYVAGLATGDSGLAQRAEVTVLQLLHRRGRPGGVVAG